jgi:hypothetical protein
MRGQKRRQKKITRSKTDPRSKDGIEDLYKENCSRQLEDRDLHL